MTTEPTTPDPASSGAYADPGGTPIPADDPEHPENVAPTEPQPTNADGTPIPTPDVPVEAPPADAPAPVDTVPTADAPAPTPAPDAVEHEATITDIDTGNVPAATLTDAWNEALAEHHGRGDDGSVQVPAPNRDTLNAILAFGNALAAGRDGDVRLAGRVEVFDGEISADVSFTSSAA